MIAKATLTEPQLTRAALQHLPSVVDPALAGLARTLQRGLERQGLALETSTGPEGYLLTDTSPGAFAREFGTLETAPDPLMQDAVAEMSAGLLTSPDEGGEG